MQSGTTRWRLAWSKDRSSRLKVATYSEPRRVTLCCWQFWTDKLTTQWNCSVNFVTRITFAREGQTFGCPEAKIYHFGEWPASTVCLFTRMDFAKHLLVHIGSYCPLWGECNGWVSDLANVRRLTPSHCKWNGGEFLLWKHPVRKFFIVRVIRLFVINVNVFITHQLFWANIVIFWLTERIISVLFRCGGSFLR